MFEDGMALFPIVLSWCANIFISSSNILLQSGSRPSYSSQQLTYSSSSVPSLSCKLLLLPLGVAGRSGFGVPSCLGSVGFSGVVLVSFPVAAGGVVPASFLVGAGRVIPSSLLVGGGGIVAASLSAGVLVPSSHPPSARSMKSRPTLLPSLSFSFPLVDGVCSGSILLLLGDGGGMGIPWLAGSIPWAAGGVPWSAGSADGEMV